MRKAIIISLLLHGGLLLWAFGSFMTPSVTKKTDSKSIAVEVMSASQFSQLKAGVKEAKNNKKKSKNLPKKKKPVKKASKPKKIVHAKVNKVVAKAAHAPSAKKAIPKKPAKEIKVVTEVKSAKAKPDPVVVKKKKVVKKKPKVKVAKKKVKRKPKAKKPKPKKKVVKAKRKKKKKVKKVARRKKLPKRKSGRRKKKFDSDDIYALLNKVPDAGGSVQPDKPVKKWKRQRMASADNAPVRGRRNGWADRVSASEIDFFRAQVSRCWNPPVGGLGSDSIKIKLRLTFNRDGTLRDLPRLLNRQNSPVFYAAADSAMRAVSKCQPYSLPKAKYKEWKEMHMNFDPHQMHGGY